MPELPEVETIKRDLSLYLLGATLKDFYLHNRAFFLKRKLPPEALRKLLGQRISEIQRKGKILALIFEDSTLIFHLGLTGSLIYQNYQPQEDPHQLLSLIFDRGHLNFRDIRKFGKIWLLPKENLPSFWQEHLGPDALEISKSHFVSLLRTSKGPIKKFLLNQKNLAGLGNIYVDELLFRSRIHPQRKVETLTLAEIETLHTLMKKVLEEAIELRGSSIRDYVDGSGERGKFQEKHLVYGKRGQPCPQCGNPLSYMTIHGRGTTFCQQCQR